MMYIFRPFFSPPQHALGIFIPTGRNRRELVTRPLIILLFHVLLCEASFCECFLRGIIDLDTTSASALYVRCVNLWAILVVVVILFLNTRDLCIE